MPDIVTVDEARRLFAATRVVSYRVFYFTLLWRLATLSRETPRISVSAA